MARGKGPGWRGIARKRKAIVARLPGETFLATVLEGCWRVARDKRNPLRGNLLASGLREVIGHLLHGLASDEEVRRCVWFKQTKGTTTVTRRQRAEYIVRAGLPDAFIDEKLRLNLADYTDPIVEAVDELSKRTHVRPDTIVADGPGVRELFHSVLEGVCELLEAADDSRAEIARAVADVMQDAVFENLISETIQEVDELSTHSTVDGHVIDTVKVVRMNSSEIAYRITGEVEIELQYGSNSDVDNDIGYRDSTSLPYFAEVSCGVADPMDVDSEAMELRIDNRSFFE